jgi:hypothetical protein
MRQGSLIFYSTGISVAFVVLHIAFVSLDLGDMANLMFSLIAMIACLELCYRMAAKKARANTLLSLLAITITTQVFSVLLLAFNSAYNPFVDNKPLKADEIFLSLAIFAVVVPCVFSILSYKFRLSGKS